MGNQYRTTPVTQDEEARILQQYVDGDLSVSEIAENNKIGAARIYEILKKLGKTDEITNQRAVNIKNKNRPEDDRKLEKEKHILERYKQGDPLGNIIDDCTISKSYLHSIVRKSEKSAEIKNERNLNIIKRNSQTDVTDPLMRKASARLNAEERKARDNNVRKQYASGDPEKDIIRNNNVSKSNMHLILHADGQFEELKKQRDNVLAQDKTRSDTSIRLKKLKPVKAKNIRDPAETYISNLAENIRLQSEGLQKVSISEIEKRILEAKGILSEEYIAVFTMQYEQNLSTAEISGILGKTKRNVRSALKLIDGYIFQKILNPEWAGPRKVQFRSLKEIKQDALLYYKEHNQGIPITQIARKYKTTAGIVNRSIEKIKTLEQAEYNAKQYNDIKINTAIYTMYEGNAETNDILHHFSIPDEQTLERIIIRSGHEKELKRKRNFKTQEFTSRCLVAFIHDNQTYIDTGKYFGFSVKKVEYHINKVQGHLETKIEDFYDPQDDDTQESILHEIGENVGLYNWHQKEILYNLLKYANRLKKIDAFYEGLSETIQFLNAYSQFQPELNNCIHNEFRKQTLDIMQNAKLELDQAQPDTAHQIKMYFGNTIP